MQVRAGYVVLVLRGELVLDTVREVRELLGTLLAGGAPRIVIDAGGLVWADEAGGHMLAVARGAAAAAGVELVLARVAPSVLAGTVTADVTDPLPCYDTIAAAGTGGESHRGTCRP